MHPNMTEFFWRISSDTYVEFMNFKPAGKKQNSIDKINQIIKFFWSKRTLRLILHTHKFYYSHNLMRGIIFYSAISLKIRDMLFKYVTNTKYKTGYPKSQKRLPCQLCYERNIMCLIIFR